MADGFKHIRVTPAEEDDEVIVAGIGEVEGGAGVSGNAGAPEAPAEGAPEVAPVSESAAVPVAEPEAAPAAEPEPASAPVAAPAPAPAAEPEAAPASAPRPQPPSRSRDGAYREPTLDDLEGEKMPLAQRIVIVAAVVCIIGALVYYFLAMR